LNGKVAYANPAARALLGDRLAELCQPAEAGWEQIKQNASRTVYRKTFAGQEVYLKHYHSRTIVHRLGRLLGFSDARKEMRFSHYLSVCGLETAQPLASVCCNGLEWLATLAVTPAERADEWHGRQLAAGAPGRKKIQSAICALAETVGRMHAAGILHRDLHAENIFVREEPERVTCVLMDLHRMVKRRKLSRRARVANLAQLFHDRADWTSRTEKLRFLKHYLTFSRAGGTLRGWQRLVENFAYRHRQRLYTRRDRRILADNKYFSRIRLPGHWRGHVALASKRKMAGSQAAQIVFQIEDWRTVLSQPERLTETADKVIKDTPSGKVILRELTIGSQQVRVIIKRPSRRQPWKILRDCFRSARTIRAFRLGHALLTRRIATALPLVALERRIGPLLLDSILVTELVEGQKLNEFLNQWLGCWPQSDVALSADQRRLLAREVLWQMGRLLQRLHDNGFHHRDLKGPNMLVQWSLGDSPEIVLLDLDGLRRIGHVTMRQRFQGLMRLNVSLLRCPPVNHAGRLRMLLGYLRRPGSGRIRFKPYWRVMENWSARKLRQQIHARRQQQKAIRR